MTDRHTQWLREEGLDKPRRPRAPKRKSISLSDKVAALLCLRRRPDGRPLIPDAVRAKGKAAVLAYPIDWDHVIALGLCGPDAFDNLVPLSKQDHAVKTAGDQKAIAKCKRLRQKQEAFRARLLARNTGSTIPLEARRGRTMLGSKDSPFKKKINGRVERRS